MELKKIFFGNFIWGKTNLKGFSKIIFNFRHCFILVCNDDENILMASNFLTILETFAKEELVKIILKKLFNKYFS